MTISRPARRWIGGMVGALALHAAGGGRAGAQVVNFRQYTNAEGLPQAQVLAIHQDRLGYIWFATYGGLSRFNGADFSTLTTDDGLSSNSVFDVTEDRQGRLVIGTSLGVCIIASGSVRCHGEAEGLVHNNVRSVAVDASGGIWVGTTLGLSYVTNGAIRNYTTSEGLPDERVVRVVVDSSGGVWVATAGGLGRLEKGRIVLDSPEVFGSRRVQFIAPSGRGVLVGVAGRLYHRAGDSLKAVAEGAIPDGTVMVDGATAPDGTIWVGTTSGVLRIRHGRVDRLDRRSGLHTEMITRVAIDREGNVWFGTENGASKHVPGPFRTYTEQEGLPSPFVRAIQSDVSGRLWVGTRNGVAVLDGERFVAVPLPNAPEPRVYSLAAEPGGGMLIGTRRGVIWYSRGRTRVYREGNGLPGEVVYSLLADRRGGVWIGTDRGLAHWKDGAIRAVDRPGVAGSSIMTMALDGHGRLWMGRTAGGIAILHGDSVRLLGPDDGVTEQTIWALREDRRGRMWAATNGDGALRIDNDSVRRFTVRDGLASNFVWQVLSDVHGDIWLFGNLGLNRVSDDKLTHFGRGSGLIELEGSANAAFMDADGNLWFGSGAGVVLYEPELDVHTPVPPPIHIEELLQAGEPVPTGRVTAVRPRLGALQIRFASPSFRDESAVRFRHRLLGADTVWSVPSPERSVTFAGLSPGRYRFEVVATNGSTSSGSPASVDFTVLPSLWQTWWFRLFGIVLLGAAAAAVPLVRARSLERERRRLEGLVARHTQELADKNARLEQSNRDLEHFAYVASHDLQEPLRKIQSFSDRVVKQYASTLDDQGRDYLGRMSSAAARMQKLIEALLALSRVTTKKGPIEVIDLGDLAREVSGDLDVRVQSTGGRVEIGDLPVIEGDPVQIRQLFQNLIGNALKFHRPGEKPVVRVSATRRSDSIEILVEDNGIGFESKEAERVFLPFHRLHSRTSYEGTGIGLTICQKIVERHGGTIRAESSPGIGSRFIVRLPAPPLTGERHAA